MLDAGVMKSLRDAIEAEASDASALQERYRILSAKLAAFDRGEGSAPTIKEFSEWREAVEHRVHLRKLQLSVLGLGRPLPRVS